MSAVAQCRADRQCTSPRGARVTVLMAVYNQRHLAVGALASIAAQTYADVDVVLVDDGSTRFDRECWPPRQTLGPRLRIYEHRHVGLTRALNFAARRALQNPLRPDYLARLDADDRWEPDKLARQVAYMDRHPDVVLVGGVWRLPGGQDTGPLDLVGPPSVGDAGLRDVLRRRNPFAHSTVLIRRSAFERVGGYDESFPVAQDWDLWIRLAQIGRLAALPDCLATLGASPQQITRRRPWARRWHGFRARWRARTL